MLKRTISLSSYLLLMFLLSNRCNLIRAQESVESRLMIDPLLCRDNLVAWCIVPFDAKHRSPQDRAAMLKRLGIKKVAYDWRAEHVASFEDEIIAYRESGLEFFAFWDQHEVMFELFEKYRIHPQVWKILPSPSESELANLTETESPEERKKQQSLMVESAARTILPLVERTRELGCKLGIYNHGGWSGEPENMLAVCRWLHQNADAKHVGIVYNFHHGHQHIPNFSERFTPLKPYLLCVNINGMNQNAEPKILGVGKGQHERTLFQAVRESGYQGPIGILDHRDQLDAEVSLTENISGRAALLEH